MSGIATPRRITVLPFASTIWLPSTCSAGSAPVAVLMPLVDEVDVDVDEPFDAVEVPLDVDELVGTCVVDDGDALPPPDPFDPQAAAAAAAIRTSPEIRKERMMVQSLRRVRGRHA
jgi:hypothetical protein